jgi:dihydropteroate synthase
MVSAFNLDLSKPQVMGILNATPDSLWHGYSSGQLLRHAETMVQDGAAILDVGGESTRPGATPVSVQEELDRVIPVIETLHREFKLPISVDTSQPVVMREAIAAGASFINDVRALQIEGALDVAAKSQAFICLMHSKIAPSQMKNVNDYTAENSPRYVDVVDDVKNFLASRLAACLAAGISADRIVLDPGFGFSKNLEQSLQLLQRLNELNDLKRPLLVGLSRKSMIAAALGGLSVEDRLPASLALAVLAVSRGALIIRAHDVKATVEAITIAKMVE